MENSANRRRKGVYLAAAVALTVIGFATLFGSPTGYTDALFEPDYTILHAPPEGVLAEAGFLPGDSVVSVEGIPIEALGMYSRWPRSLARAPGESLAMTVDRNGVRFTGRVVYREQPPGVGKLQLGGTLVFLAFLLSGVWAGLTVPSASAGHLASAGLAAGLAIPTPNMESWNGVKEHLHMAALVLWALLLLRFFLFFPKPKKMAGSRLITAVIFAPWIILLGTQLVELAFHPRFYHTFNGYTGILLFGYVLLAMVALIHSWAKTPRGEVRSSGMGWVLAGFGAGIGGVLLWAVDALLLQGVAIPGSNWAPMLFGLVPVGLALGVRRAGA